MGKEISQEELEKELDNWISNIFEKEETVYGRYYLEFWENQGYDVKKYKEKLNIIRTLQRMPESYIYKKYNQN
jgi:hypothetical protein